MSSKYNVLITGCSSGLGAYMSDVFESNGHKVLRHMGSKHHDLSTLDGIESLAEEALDFGVNVLINNAAIVCPNIKLNDYDQAMINKMINVNLRAPILLTTFLLTNLKKVVNINSMVGLEVKSPRTMYSATKWGLRGFSNSLKKESNNMDILDVYPTNIRTKPERENAMDIDYVVQRIYNSFEKNEKELILDGRIM